MKKNWLLRIALVVLVLTLGTACLVSGTFAKYTTAVTGGDSAKAAKWVFGATTDKVAYGTASDQLIGIFDTVNIGEDYLQSGESLIAPGCEGDFNIVITMTGTEVGVALSSVVVLTYPTETVTIEEVPTDIGMNLKFFIGADKPTVDTGYNTNAAGFAAALKAAIDDNDITVGEVDAVKTINVYWKWVDSEYDTLFQDENVSLSITITAEQIV